METRKGLIDNLLSAEGQEGTVHTATGPSPADREVQLVQAGIHLDLVFWRPSKY